MLKKDRGGLCKSLAEEQRRKQKAKRGERSDQVYLSYIVKMASGKIE